MHAKHELLLLLQLVLLLQLQLLLTALATPAAPVQASAAAVAAAAGVALLVRCGGSTKRCPPQGDAAHHDEAQEVGRACNGGLGLAGLPWGGVGRWLGILFAPILGKVRFR